MLNRPRWKEDGGTCFTRPVRPQQYLAEDTWIWANRGGISPASPSLVTAYVENIAAFNQRPAGDVQQLFKYRKSSICTNSGLQQSHNLQEPVRVTTYKSLFESQPTRTSSSHNLQEPLRVTTSKNLFESPGHVSATS